MLKTLLVTDFLREKTNYGSWLFPVNRYKVSMMVMSRKPLPDIMNISGVTFRKLEEHSHPDPEHIHDTLYHTRLIEVGTSKRKFSKFAFQYAHVDELSYAIEVVSEPSL